MDIIILCPRGLESVLNLEIKNIIKKEAREDRGNIELNDVSLEDIYKINLYSRIASRVLVKIKKGYVNNKEEVYNISKHINWAKYFTSGKTIKVRIEGRTTWNKNIDFLALKIKDGVCDFYNEKFNVRPSVDKKNPDIRIYAYIKEKIINIYIDSSGEALFKRGFRKFTGPAPIRENLAAGLLSFLGFNEKTKYFIDPMCGSATIPIEATNILLDKAPGLFRNFSFEKMNNFDKKLWEKIKKEAELKIKRNNNDFKIIANDFNKKAVIDAQKNIKLAEVEDFIEINHINFLDYIPKVDSGFMLCNPPYGKRLEEIEELRKQYPLWASHLKKYYTNFTIAFISSDIDLPKYLRLKPKRKIPIYNGDIECRLFIFDIVEGSNRKGVV